MEVFYNLNFSVLKISDERFCWRMFSSSSTISASFFFLFSSHPSLRLGLNQQCFVQFALVDSRNHSQPVDLSLQLQQSWIDALTLCRSSVVHAVSRHLCANVNSSTVRLHRQVVLYTSSADGSRGATHQLLESLSDVCR